MERQLFAEEALWKSGSKLGYLSQWGQVQGLLFKKVIKN